MTNQEAGFAAEDHVATLPCPRCTGTFIQTPRRNFPVYDMWCNSCSVVVNVKWNKTRTLRTNAQSYAAYLAWLERGGKERFLWFAMVSPGKIEWYCAVDGWFDFSSYIERPAHIPTKVHVANCKRLGIEPVRRQRIFWRFYP